MGNFWGLHDLVVHPLTPSRFDRVTVQVLRCEAGLIVIEWMVTPASDLHCPTQPDGGRHDDLWRTTCFEAFLRPPGATAYLEFNFSPSFAWAAYRFDSYRAEMRPLEQTIEPDFDIDGAGYFLAVEFEAPLIEAGWQLGLSAVLEDKRGHKSYWALRHPPGPPDFHHPDCFVLELPPSTSR